MARMVTKIDESWLNQDPQSRCATASILLLGFVLAFVGCKGQPKASIDLPKTWAPSATAMATAPPSASPSTASPIFPASLQLKKESQQAISSMPASVAMKVNNEASVESSLTMPMGDVDVMDASSLEPATVSSADGLVIDPIPAESVLESLIVQAVAVHPRIQAARQRAAALQHRVPQVTALDDPIVGNTFWPIHDQALQTAGGRVGHQFSLAQKVPWPTKLRARGAVAQREAQVAAADVARAECEIVEAVHLAYYELWLSERLIEITNDNQEVVRDLITIAEARYRTGGRQQDVLRAELERDNLEDQLITLRRQREEARADLGALIREPMSQISTTIDDLNDREVTLRLEVLVAEAERCNPTLQGLAAEIARDRAKQCLAQLEQYPDFQLGLGYAIISDDQAVISPVANGRDNLNFSVGVTLPIWRDKINGGIREAAHQRNSTIHLREAERDRLRGQLRRLVAAAYASADQVNLFRDRLIPRTQRTLQIATADYQGGKADISDLVDPYRELLSYQIQVVRARAALASTLAQIERVAGVHGIANSDTANADTANADTASPAVASPAVVDPVSHANPQESDRPRVGDSRRPPSVEA